MTSIQFSRSRSCLLLIVLTGAMVGCGGTKILDEPVPVTLEQPLAASSDEQLSVALDWVIVRDGPGTWARNADWDEYLVRIENPSPTAVSVHSVVVYDSMLTRLEALGDRRSLVAASRQTARRYADQGVEVKAGIGSGVLVAAGVVGGTAAVGAGAAALYMSSAAAATTLGVLLAGPALIAGGVVKSVNQSRVDDQIHLRQTEFPVAVAAGQTQGLSLFYPLAPAPRKLEITYQVAGEQSPQILELDLGGQLAGLHLAE